MATKRRQDRNKRPAVEVGTEYPSAERRVEQLRRSYEKFRREHRRGTRIPQELRDAALAALEGGTTEGQVRRACRISRTQLGWWRRSERASGRKIEPSEQQAKQARVFPVVDDVGGIAVGGAGEHEAHSVQLRVGRWEISIRQVQW